MAKSNDNACGGPDDATITAWARFVRAGQSVLAAVEGDLKRQGFPPLIHYDALLELRRAAPDGLRPFELQREMLLAQYGLSRLVERLVRAGQVERRAAADDGRGQVLYITQTGRDLLKRMWPVYAKAIQTHFGAHLSHEETLSLTATLGKLGA